MFRIARLVVLISALGVPMVALAETDVEKIQELLDRNQPALALEEIESLLGEDPENPDLLGLKETAEAQLAVIERASRIDQLLAEAEAYLSAGQKPSAQQRLATLLELDPEHAEATRLMGELELESELDLLAAEAEGSVVQEGDFVDVDQLDVRPQVIRRYSAHYPRLAHDMGIEGKASFLAFVGVDGKVEDVRVIQRIEGFDEMNRAAERAVRRYVFSPAQKDGVKVRTIVNLSVDFRL